MAPSFTKSHGKAVTLSQTTTRPVHASSNPNTMGDMRDRENTEDQCPSHTETSSKGVEQSGKMAPVLHLNGDNSPESAETKQSSIFPQPLVGSTPVNLNGDGTEKASSSTKKLKSIAFSPSDPFSRGMVWTINRPSLIQDKDTVVWREPPGQSGSRVPVFHAYTATAGNVNITQSGSSHLAGSHVTTCRPRANMCKKVGGGRTLAPVPFTNTSSETSKLIDEPMPRIDSNAFQRREGADASREVVATGVSELVTGTLKQVASTDGVRHVARGNVLLPQHVTSSDTSQQLTVRLVPKPVPSSLPTASTSSSSAQLTGVDTRQVQTQVSKKQTSIERQVTYQVTRLNCLKAKRMVDHTQQQLSGFVKYQHQHKQTRVKSDNISLSHHENNSDLNRELLREGAKHMSTAGLVSLVHKLQKAAPSLQQPQLMVQDVTCSSGMCEEDRKDSRTTAEKLAMQVRATQSALDSDATESSSDGESDGEEETGVEYPLPSTPLVRRAEWKWAKERAAAASRWTWLQAQVSELESRLRRLPEAYRQIRNAKDFVVLDDRPAPAQGPCRDGPLPSAPRGRDGRTGFTSLLPAAASSQRHIPTILSGVHRHASHLMGSHGTRLSRPNTGPPSTVGRFLPRTGPSSLVAEGQSEVNSSTSEIRQNLSPHLAGAEPASGCMDISSVPDSSCRAARCLPLRYPLRRRRLFRISDLPLIGSTQSTRVSTVKCQCQQTGSSCVLCCGGTDRVQTVDPCYMRFEELVSLLDPSFHPVLSFREDVPLSVHFEGLLRSRDRQPVINQPRIQQGQRKRKGSNLPDSADGRRNKLRKKALSVLNKSAKISAMQTQASQQADVAQGQSLGGTAVKMEVKSCKKMAATSGLGLKKTIPSLDLTKQGVHSPAAACSTKTGPGRKKGKRGRRRRGTNTHDMYRIVIPSSMACARVEDLKYEEIVTPRWREIQAAAAAAGNIPQTMDIPDVPPVLEPVLETADEEIEDLSDESYIRRHLVCEMMERSRFTCKEKRRRGRPRSQANNTTPGSTAHDPPRPVTPITPLSMGMQASLDSMPLLGDGCEDSSMQFQGASDAHLPGGVSPVGFTSLGQSTGSMKLGDSDATPHSGSAHHGGLPAFQHVRSTQGCSMGSGEGNKSPTILSWPLRQFPLCDEEASKLEAMAAETYLHKNTHFDATSGIRRLEPDPLEGSSQTECSPFGSLPPSPALSNNSGTGDGHFMSAGDSNFSSMAEGCPPKERGRVQSGSPAVNTDQGMTR